MALLVRAQMASLDTPASNQGPCHHPSLQQRHDTTSHHIEDIYSNRVLILDTIIHVFSTSRHASQPPSLTARKKRRDCHADTTYHPSRCINHPGRSEATSTIYVSACT